MIYTLTLNPAIDLEMQLDKWAFDDVSRAQQSQMDVGGKGFNVSRMLTQLGVANTALGIVGGYNGERIKQSLSQQGIHAELLNVAAETRTNVTLVNQQNGQHLKVNQTGEPIAASDLARLSALIDSYLKAGDWWVLAGSLPPGVEPKFYADVIGKIKSAGSHVLLDTSGPALALGCQAKPDVIKPNLSEVKGLLANTDARLYLEQNHDELITFLPELLNQGPKQAVVSLGEGGAMMVTPDETRFYPAFTIKQANPIGAGDAMVAGLVWRLSLGEGLAQALPYAMACGAATASLAGTSLGSLEQVAKLMDMHKK